MVLYRLLLSIDRSKEIVDALETVKLAQQYNKSIPAIVVGIDLSGNPEVRMFRYFLVYLNFEIILKFRVRLFHCESLFMYLKCT